MPKKGSKSNEPGERVLSRPERDMRDTIQWLLALPQAEREQMERAENYTFTMSQTDTATGPAPSLDNEKASASSSCTIMNTVNLPSVETTLMLTERGYRPAVLNFAHGYNCGGGFEHSGGSQEEDIFRKTSVFLSLWPHRRIDDGPGVLKRGMWIGDFDEDLPRKEPFYPHTECGGIYSPHVRAVRDDKRNLHPKHQLRNLPTFAVLTVAAQDVGREKHFNPKILEQKIRTALHMAASHGHDSVVLGAFGCGYFNNPPEVVANTFRNILASEFKDVFRVILFGVIGGNERVFGQCFPMLKAQLPCAESESGPSRKVAEAKGEKKDGLAQAAPAASSAGPNDFGKSGQDDA